MSELVKYDTANGEVVLSKEIVRQYLCPSASDEEIYFFLRLCQYQKLNPFLREVYLLKYDRNRPATMVVGKDVFLKRAEKHPQYDGHEVEVFDTNGHPFRGIGKIGYATATVHRKDRKHSTSVTVMFSEYNKQQSSWMAMPATMIRKVALEQALRESFPTDFIGLYGPEEMPGVDVTKLPETPVTVPRDGHDEGLVAAEEPYTVEEPEELEEEDVEPELPTTVTPPPTVIPGGTQSHPMLFHPVNIQVVPAPVLAAPVPPLESPPKKLHLPTFRVIATLGQLYGPYWPKQLKEGRFVSEYYFGTPLKTSQEMDRFAKLNPEAWQTGCAKLAHDAQAPAPTST